MRKIVILDILKRCPSSTCRAIASMVLQQTGLFTWITNAATPEIAQGGFQSGGGSGGRQAGRSIAEKVSSPTANVDGSTENSNSAQAVTASTYSSAHKQGQTRKHFKCSGDNLKNCDGYEFVAERSVSYHDGLEQVRASSGAEATNQLYNKLPLVDVNDGRSGLPPLRVHRCGEHQRDA